MSLYINILGLHFIVSHVPKFPSYEPSAVVEVEHQGLLLPSLVHSEYVVPLYLKGNTHFFPLVVTQPK